VPPKEQGLTRQRDAEGRASGVLQLGDCGHFGLAVQDVRRFLRGHLPQSEEWGMHKAAHVKRTLRALTRSIAVREVCIAVAVLATSAKQSAARRVAFITRTNLKKSSVCETANACEQKANAYSCKSRINKGITQ
jgi:hypothetical protein